MTILTHSLLLLQLLQLLQFQSITSFQPSTHNIQHRITNFHPPTKITTSTSTTLHSLKPAAIPLLDSGKALARSGELLIDYTSTSEYKLYGGGLSSTGASIRNAGDCIAQAGASTRFKTAIELVCDELREAATCLLEGYQEKLPKGVDDAIVDEYSGLAETIGDLIPHMECASLNLELAGEKIMKKDTVESIGVCLVDSGECLHSLALGIQKLGAIEKDGELVVENEESKKAAKESCNRMLFAAEKMKEAGNNLKGVQPVKKKGKAWLKG